MSRSYFVMLRRARFWYSNRRPGSEITAEHLATNHVVGAAAALDPAGDVGRDYTFAPLLSKNQSLQRLRR